LPFQPFRTDDYTNEALIILISGLKRSNGYDLTHEHPLRAAHDVSSRTPLHDAPVRRGSHRKE